VRRMRLTRSIWQGVADLLWVGYRSIASAISSSPPPQSPPDQADMHTLSRFPHPQQAPSTGAVYSRSDLGGGSAPSNRR
jgi:hypothetical protein